MILKEEYCSLVSLLCGKVLLTSLPLSIDQQAGEGNDLQLTMQDDLFTHGLIRPGPVLYNGITGQKYLHSTHICLNMSSLLQILLKNPSMSYRITILCKAQTQTEG